MEYRLMLTRETLKNVTKLTTTPDEQFVLQALNRVMTRKNEGIATETEIETELGDEFERFTSADKARLIGSGLLEVA